MEQRVSLITLGVADLTRARSFYARLGWAGQEVEETVFFQAGGLALVLWSRQKLAQDAGVMDEGLDSFGRFTLAHNVRTKAEVDSIVDTAQHAGATVTRAPADTFYGGARSVDRRIETRTGRAQEPLRAMRGVATVWMDVRCPPTATDYRSR